MPFILWQLWLFIAPGLYANEKKFAIPFVLFSSIFFFAGARLFALHRVPVYLGVLPEFRVGPREVHAEARTYLRALRQDAARFRRDLPDAGDLVLALSRMGLVNARFLIRNTKYAILIIFILGAVLSPGGDIPSQLMMAGPMLVLYAISIIIAWVFGRSKDPESAR